MHVVHLFFVTPKLKRFFYQPREIFLTLLYFSQLSFIFLETVIKISLYLNHIPNALNISMNVTREPYVLRLFFHLLIKGVAVRSVWDDNEME